MAKRRRTKASTVAKAKGDDKNKVMDLPNSKETYSENANISVDDSPSTTKKPKLNSNQSPKKSKKYVPPFTASQRVSSRLRNMRQNSEKSESSSQEANIFKDLEDEVLNVLSSSKTKEENIPRKDEKGISVMVSEANEEKTDTVSSNALVDTSTKQSDFKMKEDFKGKDSKRIKENSSGNILETSLKQSGIETQSVESSAMKYKDEKPHETNDQCGHDNLLQVPKLSELAQQSRNQIETDGSNKEERKSDKCTKEIKASKLESSTVIVDEPMSDGAGLETTKLDRDVLGPEMSNAGAQISSVETRLSDCGSRLGLVDARMEDVIDLQTLADTCADEEYIDVVTVDEEPSKRFHCRVIQNQLHNGEKTGTKRLDKGKEDHENDSHSLDIDKETILSVIPEQQQQQLLHATADVMVQNKLAPFCGANLVKLTMPLSDEKDDKKAQNNEPTNRSSSLSSQEIIEDKLSEILAIVCSKEEWNEPRLSQTESEINPSLITKNANKCLENPIKTSDTEIESKSDKGTLDSLEKNCVEEKVPNSLVNNDTNSQNTAKTENIEIEQCEEMQVDNPAVTKKVKDSENFSACVNSDKNSQKASSKGSRETGGSGENLEKEKIMRRHKDVDKNDQQVPKKVATSPEQEVPRKMVTTTVIPHDEGQKLKTREEKVAASSNSFEDHSYTEEFRELEELLPTDDMGLFDDVLLSKPQSISVNNELPNGDGTIEFLINELNSLHCMVATYKRTVEDIKRQYKSSGKF